jgi:hypothetical protein
MGYDSNNKEYISGYIFKKNIIPLHKLLLLGGMPIDDSGHSITVSNDSIDATVNVIFYDNIIVNERKEQNAEKDFYGVHNDDPSPHKMLEKIIINNKGVQTVINKEQLQSYYFDIHHISIAIGFDGEFYIGIYGSGDENRYDAWFTIVAGKLVNEYVITSCW